MCDSKGVIRKDRDNLTSQKQEFATAKDINTLEEAMQNADVFIGLSKGDVVTPEMLLSMTKDPIVFCHGKSQCQRFHMMLLVLREMILLWLQEDQIILNQGKQCIRLSFYF